MLEVRGFRGFRFNKRLVGSLDRVITPPYDVISAEERSALARRSPYSMVHLILPEESGGRTRYEVSAELFQDWIRKGALRQDANESFYLLEQTFRGLDGAERVRRGFFAVTKLPEAGERIILGHERTFTGPVEDRLRLTESVRANLSSVMVLYSDPAGDLRPFLSQMFERPEDDCAYTIDRVTQRLWRVPANSKVSEFFCNKKLYIADGHHRFRMAGLLRDRLREVETPQGRRTYDYVLMGFIPFEDPGLLIHPPHRVLDFQTGFTREDFLEKLRPWFEVVPMNNDVIAALEHEPDCAFGLATHGNGPCLLRLRAVDRTGLLGSDHSEAWRDLDVAVLHRGIIERILGLPEGAELTYEHDAKRALDVVASGQKGMAFLLRPMHPEQVRACAEAGDPMPQKSTYFFPKLPSGSVVYRLD
ncbi:MAG: DUF1015 domain-containing protein [Candidatus Hydrogenedentes bacterium]|nr:DUF1015 domain-containing protein [Candidatus Hydrogenedentota bacterium]